MVPIYAQTSLRSPRINQTLFSLKTEGLVLLVATEASKKNNSRIRTQDASRNNALDYDANFVHDSCALTAFKQYIHKLPSIKRDTIAIVPNISTA